MKTQTPTQMPTPTPPVAPPPDAPVDGLDPAELWPTLTEFALNMRLWWLGLCNRLDVTPTQGLLLRQLKFGVPLPMNALADILSCDASNITGVVDKLESRGLLVRQSAENDRRVKMLSVTEKGRNLQRRMRALANTPPAAIAALPKAVRRQTALAMRSVLRCWATSGVDFPDAPVEVTGGSADAAAERSASRPAAAHPDRRKVSLG